MDAPSLIERIRGIFSALPTPFDDTGNVDVESLRGIVEHLLESGLHGFWVLGSASEFAALDEQQKRAILSTVVAQVDGRVPVIAGTSQAGTALAIESARIAADCGADAIFILAPYYYTWGEEELFDHFCAVSRASALPAIIYSNPFHSKCSLPVPLVRKLSLLPEFIGIKDSSLDFDFFQSLLRAMPRDGTFRLLQGDELSLAASLLAGADGAIAALANIAPAWCVEIYQASLRQDLARVWELQASLARLFDIFLLPGRSGDSAFCAGQKAALAALGLCRGHLAFPCHPLTGEEEQHARSILSDLALLSRSV